MTGRLSDLHQILVALDEGLCSRTALSVSMALAAEAGAEVTAVHVVRALPRCQRDVLFPYAALGSDEPAIEAELLDAARAWLLESTRETREAWRDMPPDNPLGDEIYAHIFVGEPVERIQESIRRSNADLLVMGAFGERAPTPGRIGSVVSAVVSSAARPVLVTRQADRRPAYRRILCALDGSTAGATLVDTAVHFALLTEAESVDLAIALNADTGDREQLVSTRRPGKDVRKRAENTAAQRAARALEALSVPFPREQRTKAFDFRLHTPWGDPRDALIDLVNERDVDLLVVGARHPNNPLRSRFGRVAEGLLRLAPCDVLVVPGGWLERLDD